MKTITVVAVDDCQFILDAFRSNINWYPDIELVGTGLYGENVIPLLEQHRPDVLLLDQSMKQHAPSNGPKKLFKTIPTIKLVKRLFPETKIIIVSAWDSSPIVHHVLMAGASGYLSKADAHDIEIGEIIREVMRNAPFLSKTAAENYESFKGSKLPLTIRQIQVANLLARIPKADYIELGAHLGIVASTVEKHLTDLMKRSDTPRNRLAAVDVCRKLGLIED